MPDSQQYLYLINNMEGINVFLDLTIIPVYMLSCSKYSARHFCGETKIENNLL